MGGRTFAVGSAVATGEGQQPGVPAEVGQADQLLCVDIPCHVVDEVALAQVEEEALHEEVDQLFEEAVLEPVVALHELERGEDIVLLLPNPLHHAIMCVHDHVFTTGPGISFPFAWLRSGRPHPAGGPMAVSAYILIQTEVGKAAQVAQSVGEIDGVVSAEDVTGPYDVIARSEATSVDELGKMVVSRVQMIDGITRTLTCPVVHL